MPPPLILILEEEKHADKYLEQQLNRQGFKVVRSSRRTECRQLFEEAKPDLTIIDSGKQDVGQELKTATLLRQIDRSTPLFLIVHESSESKVIAALRAGFNDYFKRPLSFRELLDSIRRHLTLRRPAFATPPSKDPGREPAFITSTSGILELKKFLVKAAVTDCNVLITGETGTGKELVAELLHWHSPRRHHPLVCINCAALPDSLLESELFGYERGAFTGAFASYPGKLRLAEGGTVLLDEIFEMSPPMQAKMLRALEFRKIYRLGGRKPIPLNIRYVATTNQDPERAMREGRLRQDLYYRLNVARIHLPPLRNRPADIPLLLKHFLEEMNHRYHRRVEEFSPELMALFLSYAWPGNIRELRNLVEALFINLPPRVVTLAHIPDFIRPLLENQPHPREEQEQLLQALMTTNWNKSQAAAQLQWSRMTLYRKMAKYKISGSGDRGVA
jgi:DNA-binding NtrC family response regulator